MSDFVEVVNSNGERQVVPRHWLDIPALAGPFTSLEPEPPTEPAASDRKAAWVDYAVTQGADPDEAAAATKAALIEQYAASDEDDDPNPGHAQREN